MMLNGPHRTVAALCLAARPAAATATKILSLESSNNRWSESRMRAMPCHKTFADGWCDARRETG